jgi:hypothetical protein
MVYFGQKRTQGDDLDGILMALAVAAMLVLALLRGRQGGGGG